MRWDFKFWKSFLALIWHEFLELLFPALCVGCKKEGNWLCAACESKIKLIKLTRSDLLGRSDLLSICYYKQPIIQQLFYGLKEERIKSLGDICAQISLNYIKRSNLLKRNSDDPWQITFVPMHFRKQRVRGFNQTELIAKGIARGLGLECIDSLEKVRQTKAQKDMNQEQRYENVGDAFRAKCNIAGKKLILFDDIFTTGNTLYECRKTLLAAGAKEVKCLTFAKD